jgi:hypothetical protein
MFTAHQQAAAVQHVLVQTLLQQQQQSSAGAGVPALLGQQMPGVLQLLQALTAAGGVRPVAQLPVAAPASPLDLHTGLTPAAAAGCPHLLQALGAAAGGQQAPFAAPAFSAGTLAPAASRFSPAGATTVARPLTSVMGSGAQGATAAYMGSVPAAPAVAGPSVGQMQAMFGQLPGFMGAPAVAAAPGWPGYGQVNAVLGVTGMQPHVFPGRVAV